LSEPRRSGRPRKARASSPSAAGLGIVTVGPDFQAEYPDGEPRAAEIHATLIRTGQALIAEVDRAMLASIGAPQTVLNSLAVIEGADHPLTPGEISERTLTSSATMTATIDALERRGWVRRVSNPDDRRSVHVEITDDGQAVTDRFLPGIRKLDVAICASLSSAERTTMLELLTKVLAQLAIVAAEPPMPLEGRRNRPQRNPNEI
jgi:DNA-binding MarR family transcriptional regulator